MSYIDWLGFSVIFEKITIHIREIIYSGKMIFPSLPVFFIHPAVEIPQTQKNLQKRHFMLW